MQRKLLLLLCWRLLKHLLLTILKMLLTVPRRSFKRKLTTPSVKHSGTFVDNIGQGSNALSLIVLKTSGGPRSTTGAPQTIQSLASTDEDCRTGDVVKFVNLHIQAARRDGQGTKADGTGWLEWAFILVRENETAVPSTRLGLQTLGDICTNMYRGECIYTGSIPVGAEQPVVGEISLKIPKTKTRIKLGDEWRFITFFRSTDSASGSGISVRLLKSFNYLVRS